MALPDIEQALERSVYEALRLVTVAEGYLPNIRDYDIENPDINIAKQAVKDYNTAAQTIRQNKGFVVEIFNYSSAEARGLKKTPRIVIQTEAFQQGQIGFDNRINYEYNEQLGEYVSKRSPAVTSDFYFNIHLVASDVKQIRVLHGIMVTCLPRLGYIKWYTDAKLRPSHNLLVYYLSYLEADFLAEGIIEKIYRYRIPDAHEIDDEIITQIPPIKIIDVDITGNVDDNLTIE